MRRRIAFDECDSPDEVCGWLNKIRADQDLMESKIIQNAQEIEALKPKKKVKKKVKKKGSAMKSKGFALTRVLAVLLLVIAITGLCYAAYVPGDITYEIADNPEMLATYLRDVTSNMASYSYLFTPLAAAPQAATGRVYYNSGTNRWVGYNGTAWLNFDIAGGVTLDGAYDSGGAGLGRTINVNDGALVFTNNELDNADILQLTHTGAGATRGLLVTINGTEPAIEIENTSTGYDIEGTGATWYATNGGTIVGVAGDLTGAAGLTLQNDETITNAANGSITFTDTGGNTLIFDMDDGATTIQLDSGDVTTFSFGTVDDLTEIGNITFDQAAAAITLDGNAAGEDLTIAQTANAGAADCSIILDSDGTALDAIILVTGNDGGIDVDADEDISITVTSDAGGEDLLLTQSGAQDASIILTSDGTGNDAIKLETTAVTGDIWIDTGDDLVIDVAGFLDLDLVGAFDLDGAAGVELTSSEGNADSVIITSTAGGIDILAVNTNAAGEDIDITLTGATDSSIDLSSSGTGADAIIAAATAGGIDVDAALGITIDNAGASSDITIDSAAGSLNLTGAEAAADAVTVTSGGGIDIAAVDDVDFILTANAAGEDFTIQCTGAADTTLSLLSSGTAANAIELITTAGGIDITNVASAAGEDVDISSNRAVNITSSEATDLAILVQTSNAAGNIRVQSADASDDALDINATAGGMDVDVALQLSLVSSEAAADAVVIDASDAAGGMDIDAGSGTIDVDCTAGAITIDNDGGGNDITLTSDGGSIYLKADQSDAQAVWLDANTGANGGVDIDAAAGGVDIDATAGNIGIDTTGAFDIHIDSAGGRLELIGGEGTATDIVIDAENAAGGIDVDAGTNGINVRATSGDININTTGNVGDRIDLINTTGTGVSLAAAETAAIQLYADAGGIGLNSGLGAANAIRIEADGGAGEIIMIHSNQGTGASAATQVDASVQIMSDVGGIGLYSGLAGADAIRLETNGGAAEIIMLHSNQGTGVAATGEVDSSIQLMSDDGGIGLYTTSNLANAIRIEANGGGNETININSVQGTAAGSILLNSVLGGITITANAAAKDVDINSVLGSITIEAERDGASAISIVADGGNSTTMLLHADTGTSVTENASAITLWADEGGINIQSDANLDDAITIRVDGGAASEITIHNDQATTADSIEIISDEGGVTIFGGADDNITLTTGTAGGAGGVVFTNGQTRKTLFYPMHVELDGASPPALATHGTNGQTNVSILEFDANLAGGTGDDTCYISWMVPDGYVTDSARLNIGYLFDTAEGLAADEAQFDFNVNSVAPGEAVDGAGTALADQTTVVADATADNGNLHVTQYNIEVEDIVIDDLVTIKISVDESASEWDQSGTCDVVYFEIEWESTE